MALSEDLGEQPQQLAVWSSFPHFPMGKKTHSQTQISVKNSSWKWIFTCASWSFERLDVTLGLEIVSQTVPSHHRACYGIDGSAILQWFTMIYLFCLLIFHGKLWNPQVPSRYRCEKKPSWFSWWSPNIVFCKPKTKATIWDDCYHPCL